MGRWSSHYLAKSQERELEPVYALIICEDYTYTRPADTFLEDAIGAADTAIDLASDGEFTIDHGDTLIMYDRKGFEFIVAQTWDQVNQDIDVATRGQFGTTAKSFDRGAVVAKPLAYFSTDTISGTTLPFFVGMEFPSGGGQSVDIRENQTTIDDVSVIVQDPNGDIPRYFKRKPIIGLRAILLGGYRGMTWANYSFLSVGTIADLEIAQTNIYQFTIESIMSELKVNLFGDFEDFSAELDTTFTSAGSAFLLNQESTAYLNSGAQTMSSIGSGWMVAGTLLKCGIVYKIGANADESLNEYVLAAGGTGPLISVAVDGRGYWNTTVQNHSDTSKVKMFFGFEGHPIDFLIGLLFTKHSDTDPLNFRKVNDSSYHYDWGAVVDIDKGPLSLGLQFGDAEIQTFTDIRDRWFADYIFRYKINKRLDMENAIPKNILKPLGCALYVNRAGKLALMIMKPPLSTNAEPLTQDDIIGVPRLKYQRDEIANAARIAFDYYDGDFLDEARLIDAESQVTYKRKDEIDIECIGLDTNWRGESIAERLMRNKLRPIKDPNPIVAVDVLFSRASIEIGDVLPFDHPDIPDVIRGRVGWNKLLQVIGKHPDYQTGALSLDLIDTQGAGKRYGLISASGTPNYTSASDVTKASYAFISNGTTETMSNGDEGYLVS